MTRSRTIALNCGTRMPVLGFGTLDREHPELRQRAVETAFATGYRLIDTAASYNSERDVGRAIAASGINRFELFVTTKLWPADYGYDAALKAFDLSLAKLGLDYVDLYLLHWPAPKTFETTVQACEAAERLRAEGRARSIGVANFGVAEFDALAVRCDVVPAVNQVEIHTCFNQEALHLEHARRGMVTEAWSPLGLSVRRANDGGKTDPLAHPTIRRLAPAHGKTPAQILLRWHIQRGLVAIPKSVRAERIAENIDIFDFALSADDMAAIDVLDKGLRGGPDPEIFDLDFLKARESA